MTLEEWNDAPAERARAALVACCGSKRWAEQVIRLRPFSDTARLHESAERVWTCLTPADWLEAFSKHPKIGERSGSAWSAQEQGGMSSANSDMAEAIGRLNKEYEQRFGWIFIICATGKSATEMLAAVEQRLLNDQETEVRIAAAEQSKIMHLRIDKLLSE